MGHCYSSSQLGSHRRFFPAGGRSFAAGSPSFAGPRATDASAEELNRWNFPERLGSAARHFLLGLLRLYRIFLGPFLGGACKFYPSCSHYAYEAVSRYGARRGTVLALKRLGRCRPFTQGGFDPVPDPGDQDPNTARRKELADKESRR